MFVNKVIYVRRQSNTTYLAHEVHILFFYNNTIVMYPTVIPGPFTIRLLGLSASLLSG